MDPCVSAAASGTSARKLESGRGIDDQDLVNLGLCEAFSQKPREKTPQDISDAGATAICLPIRPACVIAAEEQMLLQSQIEHFSNQRNDRGFRKIFHAARTIIFEIRAGLRNVAVYEPIRIAVGV